MLSLKFCLSRPPPVCPRQSRRSTPGAGPHLLSPVDSSRNTIAFITFAHCGKYRPGAAVVVDIERIETMWPRGGWIGLLTNLNFFCKVTVRVRNFRDYFRNLRTRQPPKIITELPRSVSSEQLWRKLRITWRKIDLPNSRRYLGPSKMISKQRTS
jgi:hypothetical protein